MIKKIEQEFWRLTTLTLTVVWVVYMIILGLKQPIIIMCLSIITVSWMISLNKYDQKRQNALSLREK